MTVSPYLEMVQARIRQHPRKTSAHVEHFEELKIVTKRALGWANSAAFLASLPAREQTFNALNYAEEDLKEALAAISKAREAIVHE